MPRVRSRTGFIVSPLFDAVFFVHAPLIAIVAGMLGAIPRWNVSVSAANYHYKATFYQFFASSFTMAHLFIVFFRTHLNPKIFRLFPVRFLLVPPLMFAMMLSSQWFFVSMLVLATWWDVYHSAMQTFGLGRIYDSKLGNDPKVGRRLDMMINLLLYIGPIAGGKVLLDHLHSFDHFKSLGAVFFTSIPGTVSAHAIALRWLVIGAGLPMVAYYVTAYAALSRAGYRVSRQKVALFTSTALCSIYAWGFNPFGTAFFIMNFFHALQYFAIVWCTEQKTMVTHLQRFNSGWGTRHALIALLVIGFGYGILAEVFHGASPTLFALTIVVSIMHFWYDGFVWSVSRGQV